MDGHPGRIYLVEDDAGTQNSIRALLELMGFSVAHFDSAEDLLDSGIRIEDGCVLADFGLPGLNGQELFHALRDDGCRAPVVLMSGHADSHLIDGPTKAGVAAFLLKPVSPGLLVDTLRQAMASCPDGRALPEFGLPGRPAADSRSNRAG